MCSSPALVIGGGLAGCEAAFTIARFGYPVDVIEMKPKRFSPAHRNEQLGELVCSNSLGCQKEDSASGLLQYEMRALGSLVLWAADRSRVPAGQALAVNREDFSRCITDQIEAQPLIRLIRDEVVEIPARRPIIIATGPLTSDALAGELADKIGREALYFYDSISPIVNSDSIDFGKTFWANRYQSGKDDYLNCPMDRPTYERFVEELLTAEKVPVRSCEKIRCFEACCPIEILAERGKNTLAFGPMKPVGLIDPGGKRPHAVVQLRRENDPPTMYNLVGFQTRMKWNEQKRVFRMIPGLEKAEFVRYGSMHRNTFVEAPTVVRSDLSLQVDPDIFLAGQLVGVEGYLESAAMGQWIGLLVVGRLKCCELLLPPPPETALGALLKTVVTMPTHKKFSPVNMNMGLFAPVSMKGVGKDERSEGIGKRAREASENWRRQLFNKLGEMKYASWSS